MGTVYRKQSTRPMPAGAEIVIRKGERIARWTDAKGKSRSARMTTGKDGSDRILTIATTFTAKYRDGNRHVRTIATGCRDKQAALSVLADLERRAERVKSNLLTATEDAIADQLHIPLKQHFQDYVTSLKAKECSPVRIRNMESQFARVCGDCGFSQLTDLEGERFTRWLLDKMQAGMSAATRNGYRETMVMFANWCVRQSRPRLTANPFRNVSKANVKVDERRIQRNGR